MRKLIDMTGWKMWEHGVPDSRLTVIERVEDYINPNTQKHTPQWKCMCSCGNLDYVITTGQHLRNGHTISCGCIRKEKIKKTGENNQKSNPMSICGEYCIGKTLNTGSEFYFDIEDKELLNHYCWYEHIHKNGYRMLEAWDKSKQKYVSMWYVLTGYKLCDHIDRNTLNNRRNNLRPANPSENAKNHTKRKDNTSGVTGVYWDKRNNNWMVSINVNKKICWLGRYLNKKDAIVARLQAEAKYYGEFAPQQHLYEQYGITTQNDCKLGEDKYE